MARGVTLLLLVCVVPATGCEKPEPKTKPVFPVHGSVLVNGKPPVGANVIFHPLPLGDRLAVPSRGMVKADGSFQLTTYGAEDGAPEGEYAVTFYWPGKRTGKAESEDEEVPPDQLGKRYMDAASSKFKIQVKAGENRLEAFQLR